MWGKQQPKREPMPMAMIQSGDLLAWRKDSHSTWSDFLITMIRFFTRERYGHVGIAWRCHDGLDDELFVIEATMPKVRIARVVVDKRDFDCVPMGLSWEASGKGFLMSKQGFPYGLLDAVRAGLGMKLKKDDYYQCAELSREYYLTKGIDLGDCYTPGKLVRAAEQYANKKARQVVANRRT